MKRALEDIKSMMEYSFQGENIDGMDMNLEFNFSIAETMDDVEESDHLIVLGEPVDNNTPGVSNSFGGKVLGVDADYFTGLYDLYIGNEGERTTSHEMGHLFGLRHVFGYTNLMTQGRSEGRGINITSQQLRSMKSIYENSGMNNGFNTTVTGAPNLGIGYQVIKLANSQGRLKSKQ